MFLLTLITLAISKTCKNSCGDMSWYWSCQCDMKCIDRNDCCNDYIKECNRPIDLGLENLYVINSYTNSNNYNGNIDTCGKCSIVWVHGYNNNMNEALELFEDLYESYNGKCIIYTFLWDSDWDLDFHWGDLFSKKITLADQIGKGSFKHFVLNLQKKCTNTKITLMGHSLGARIIYESLKYITVDNCITISAAVDNDIFLGEFKDILNSTNLYIAYNSKDIILNTAYWTYTLFRHSALGSTGTNLVQSKNFVNDWKYDHSAIYNKKKNKRFWNYYSKKIEN